MERTRRVLITGGLGFIGSALAEHYLSQGTDVTIVDSMVSNVLDPVFLSSRWPKAHIETQSVKEYFAARRGVALYDLVIHAASLVGPAGILSHAGTIGDEIVHGTSRLIDYCVRHGAPLIYFSSAEIYGRSGILQESMDIRVPHQYNARIEYALGKLTSESMIVNSRRQGLHAVIIRPFNVVGPRQSKSAGFVLPTFVQQALTGQPITVFESGQQKRAFTDVDDIVRFVTEHAAAAMVRRTATFNVGNPANATSIADLARNVKALLKSESPIVFVKGKDVHGADYCEAESFEKLPDIAAAMELGWRPRGSLADLIATTAQYYRDHGDSRARGARRTAA